MITRTPRKISFSFIALVLTLLFSAAAIDAQTTSFTYQGKLTDGGASANGNYDFQFALWDSLTGGTQVGSTQAANNVSVSNGVFTVTLDFGANSFSGANLYVEISARPVGAGSFTLLAPRQQITSTPYAVRSANALSANTLSTSCTGCITDTQIGSVAAGKLTGTIPVSAVPSGSGSYVQNTSTQQASTNFNISGNGTAGGTLSANVLDATSQFSMGGNRILSNAGTNNLFAGIGSGQANTVGSNNSFFGSGTGQSNFGFSNSFFGEGAGKANTLGSTNSYFGQSAGKNNTTGGSNAYFGQGAGQSNTTGNSNSFFGQAAGASNTNGNFNTFIGANASITPISTGATGSNNTSIGYSANIGLDSSSNALKNATAIGANATVTQSNSLVLGSINGVNGAKASANVGIGLTAPVYRLHVVDPGAAGLRVQTNTPGGAVASFGGNGDLRVDSNGIEGGRFIVKENGNVGVGTNKPTVALEVQPSPNINAFDPKALAVHGNSVQDIGYFGFAKAMVFVTEGGTIARCYNSQVTGSASRLAPCGFRVGHPGEGVYDVVLGPPYSNGNTDLFWSVTVARNSANDFLMMQAFEISLGSIRVVISTPGAFGNNNKNGEFMLIIF